MKPGIDFIGVGTTVLIINPQNEVLLLLRSANTRNDRGKWSIPGGRVEYNEAVLDAVIRETKEEVGVDIHKPRLLGYIDHMIAEDTQHWVSLIFLAREFSGVPTRCEPDKCDDLQWFPLDAIPENSSAVVFKAVELYTKDIDN